MGQVIEFVGNHPYLIGSFVLLLVLFVRNETRRGGHAVSAQQLVNMVNRENAVVLDVRDKKDFDQLAAVVFREDFEILDAVMIPHEVVGEYARFRKHINGHILILQGSILEDSRVRSIKKFIE